VSAGGLGERIGVSARGVSAWEKAYQRSAFSFQSSSSFVLPYADTPYADPPTRFSLPLVLHHRISGNVGREFFAPMEKLQFNHKKSRPDDTSDLLNQIHGSP
jgi:hypothetical protein